MLLVRKSKIYKIRLKVPPYITSLKIILDFPDYTGIKNYVTSEPNITALRGTKVNFYAKCNTPLKQVKFKFKKGGHLKNIKINFIDVGLVGQHIPDGIKI